MVKRGLNSVTTESSIEAAACHKVFTELGVRSIKLNISGRRGWPDRMFMIPGGMPLLIEFKKPGGSVRPLQRHTHEILKALNYRVEVHDNVISAFQAVERALETPRLPEKGV